MNFLQLVQRLARDTGVAGTGPSTVVGQSGDSGRLVNWISSAWTDIQTIHPDWQWMRASASFATIDGQATYTPAQCGVTDFGAWDRNSFRNYDTAAGTSSEIFMTYQEYEIWRDEYQMGSMRSVRTRPYQVTITPAKAIGLGPTPTSGYTVIGDYYTVPTEMTLDSDTPSLPTQYHMAIVYRAMMFYGAYHAANEVYQHGQTEFKRIMARITTDRLPDIQFAGALF